MAEMNSQQEMLDIICTEAVEEPPEPSSKRNKTMNAKFEAWIKQDDVLGPGVWEFEPKAQLIQAFVCEVNARAEKTMLRTGKLEGSHYAAMQELLKEWGL